MRNEELAAALDEIGQAYDLAQKARTKLAEKKKNRPWICTVDGRSEADLEQFAQKYNMPLLPFEFEDIKFTFEEEGSELDLARKDVATSQQELENLEKAAKTDGKLLAKKEEEIRSLNQELASKSKVDADIQITLATRKEELTRNTEEKNKALRVAFSQSHSEAPSNEAPKEKIGCGKSVLLFFLGVMLSGVVVGILSEIFSAMDSSVNGLVAIFLMVIQPVLWFVPLAVSAGRINARNASSRKQLEQAADKLNAEKAKMEQEIKCNNEDLASQIAKLEQEAMAQRKENDAHRLRLEGEISSLRAEISGIEEKLRERANEVAEGIDRVNQAVNKVSELESKFAHLREQELSEYQERRVTAFLEHSAPLLEALEKAKEREMTAYAAELTDAEMELEKHSNRMQELLDKTAINGKTYPLVQMGFINRAAEIIRSGKADSWEEAIEALEAENRPTSTVSFSALRANSGRKGADEANKPNLTRSQTKSVGKSAGNSGASSHSASQPSGAGSKADAKPFAKNGRFQSTRSKNDPARPSTFGSKPSPRPRPTGGRPSGRARPAGGSAPSSAGRRKGPPKNL